MRKTEYEMTWQADEIRHGVVLSDPHKIVILRALQLGDLLCAVPAWRALRSAFPQAEIVLVGLPWAGSFAERFHRYLDRFIEFPGYPGLPERAPDLAAVPDFLRAVQAERFDLALQMHGSGSIVNPLVQLFGAQVTAGYFVQGEYCPDGRHFMRYPEGEPEVRRHLRLMEFLGIPSSSEELEFPLTDRDRRALLELPEAPALLESDYVCVHAGARSSDRRWPAKQFAAVADSLAARGLRVVLTGSAEEKDITAHVKSALKEPAIDLAGRTNLGALGVLLSNARLLVSNDTGVSHIAAALRVPSVVLFSASDPRRWAPLDQELHRALDARTTEPQAVVREAQALLQKEPARV